MSGPAETRPRITNMLTGGIMAVAILLAASPVRADPWPPAPLSLANPEKAPPLANGLRPAKPTEAEPGDDDPHYARICDAFGEGFVYSPSTGACIKIGGYVKFGAGFGARH